jgi:MGT family glycosyltransferase
LANGMALAMQDAHIAFISHPQHPHVGPMLPVMAVLVRRGYRVSCATSDLFEARVRSLGAEFVRCQRVLTSKECNADGVGNIVTRQAAGMLEEITPFYEANRPALILRDYGAVAGQILAHRWKIPVIKTSPIFAHEKRTHSRQVKDISFRKDILELSRHIDLFLGQHGIADSDWLFHRDRLNIHFCPKELQPCPESIDETCFFAGRCTNEQPLYGAWQKPDIGKRTVAFVAASTHYVRGPQFFRSCIEAFEGLGWHLILSIGDKIDAAALGPLPPHVEIVQQVSHLRILPHVHVLVCMGGIMTCTEASYHGVPMVITSHGYPEIEWQADNIEEQGTGVHLRGAELSPAELRNAALRVVNDAALLQRVREMKRKVRRSPGAEEVANVIEDYMAEVPGFA